MSVHSLVVCLLSIAVGTPTGWANGEFHRRCFKHLPDFRVRPPEELAAYYVYCEEIGWNRFGGML